jgi:hypothetical protein
VNVFKGAILVFLLAVSACHAQPVLNASTKSGNHVMLSWPVTNTTFGLEYADSLTSTNWTQVRADVTNGLCMVMDGATNSARFYRLISPFGTNLPPMFPPGVAAPLAGSSGGTYQLPPDYDDPAYLSWHFDADLALAPATIDFSKVIDPSSPTNNSLSYYWDVECDEFGDQLVGPHVYGVTTPVLGFDKDGLSNNDSTLFTLFVMSNHSGLVYAFTVDATVYGSDFSVQAATICSLNDPNCLVAEAFGTPHHTAADGYESYPPWVLAFLVNYHPD